MLSRERGCSFECKTSVQNISCQPDIQIYSIELHNYTKFMKIRKGNATSLKLKRIYYKIKYMNYLSSYI